MTAIPVATIISLGVIFVASQCLAQIQPESGDNFGCYSQLECQGMPKKGDRYSGYFPPGPGQCCDRYGISTFDFTTRICTSCWDYTTIYMPANPPPPVESAHKELCFASKDCQGNLVPSNMCSCALDMRSLFSLGTCYNCDGSPAPSKISWIEKIKESHIG